MRELTIRNRWGLPRPVEIVGGFEREAEPRGEPPFNPEARRGMWRPAVTTNARPAPTVFRTEEWARLHFWPKVDRSGGGCWPWVGTVGTGGYGRLSAAGHFHTAHRVALELVLGVDLPDDALACHKCNNPLCCRVDREHVYLGNLDTNTMDRVVDAALRRAAVIAALETW